MRNNKIYTVNLNGTEPFRADRNEALAWLWCSRVEGEKCSTYTALDPGLSHAENLKLSDFPRTGEVRNRVLELFRSAEESRCHGILLELMEHFPGNLHNHINPTTRDSEYSEMSIPGATVRFFVVRSEFVLNRKLHYYEVTAEHVWHDQPIYSGTSLKEALQAFYLAVARGKFEYAFDLMKKDGEAF